MIASALIIGIFLSVVLHGPPQTVWGLPLPAVVGAGLLGVVLIVFWINTATDGRTVKLRIAPLLRILLGRRR